MAVSFARGVSDAPDHAASALLPRPLGVLAQRAQPLPLPLRRALTAGLVDHLALRTAAIDRALAVASAGGVRQVVLLGAGLDARAWRLACLAGARLFEVDHPATQAWKRAHAAALGLPLAEVTFVPVDFASGSLDDALTAAGHAPAAPTAWVWEGVTPYLSREAIDATLDVVARRSAPGSRVVMTYALPSLTPLASFAPLALSRVPLALVRAAFAALGESLGATFRPDEIPALAAAHGLSVESDTGADAWQRADPVAGLPWRVFAERLAVLARP